MIAGYYFGYIYTVMSVIFYANDSARTGITVKVGTS